MKQTIPKVYNTLVLVTDQISCDRIIESARLVADMYKTDVFVLSVMKDSASADPQALEHLFGVAKLHGASMKVEFSENPYSAIVHAIKECRAVNVVTGLPGGKHSILVKLWKSLPNVNFYTVSQEGWIINPADSQPLSLRRVISAPAGL